MNLSIIIQKDMGDLVVDDKFECKAKVGKSRITGLKDREWMIGDDDCLERVFSFKGKKKGKVSMHLAFFLT